MLFTKCIYSPRIEADGLRISIMSRHTLPNGVTPDPRITPENYDFWFTHLAPPPKLIGEYYKRGLTFEIFSQGYREYLALPTTKEEVRILAETALTFDITVLCVESTPKKCHRRLLAEACQREFPKLYIEHR
ncbi:MAG: DUF488 domain-containing protein [Nanoarchaeota archaeon]|nr:DUF488 domain-containing protein [Nanoarchaeota archaeon]